VVKRIVLATAIIAFGLGLASSATAQTTTTVYGGPITPPPTIIGPGTTTGTTIPGAPQAGPTVAAIPSVVAPGQTVNIVGAGWQGDTSVTIDVTLTTPGAARALSGGLFRQAVVGTATVDAAGNFTFPTTAPAATGIYTVTATGVQTGRVRTTTFTVTQVTTTTTTAAPGATTTAAPGATTTLAPGGTSAGGATTTAAGGLPTTGSNSNRSIQVGLVIALVGIGLIIVATRRRSHHSA
jgi:hypothetical protein